MICLPSINLSITDDGVIGEVTARDIHNACARFGAFYLCNSDISHQIVNGTLKDAKKFFSQDRNWKKRFLASKERMFIGYRPKGIEKSENFDQKESCEQFKFGYTTDQLGEHFKLVDELIDLGEIHLSSSFEYWKQSLSLSSKIKNVLLKSLDLDENHFSEQMRFPLHQVGLNYYSALQDEGSKYSMSAHRDQCFFTILSQDTDGLEMFLDGKWYSVPSKENAVIVFIGDYFEKISSSTYKSALHRVRALPHDRYSINFKFRPSYNAKFILKNEKVYYPSHCHQLKLNEIIATAI